MAGSIRDRSAPVLTPALVRPQNAGPCPMLRLCAGAADPSARCGFPIPKTAAPWREQNSAGDAAGATLSGLGFWAFAVRHPSLYRFGTRWIAARFAWRGKGASAFRQLPLAGGWTKHRDLPLPQGRTFPRTQWAIRIPLGGMSTDRDRMLAAINAGAAKTNPAPKPAAGAAAGKVAGPALIETTVQTAISASPRRRSTRSPATRRGAGPRRPLSGAAGTCRRNCASRPMRGFSGASLVDSPARKSRPAPATASTKYP